MQHFQNFEYEIKINIFKYANSPLYLALTCRIWSVIAKDPYAKAEWLIKCYGKAHALFHTVRLGPTFIDVTVYRALIARNIVISRYFIQRLSVHFGKYDQRLIEFKIEHNVNHDRIRAFQKPLWASNLLISIFTYLLDEGYKQLSNNNDEDLPSKKSLSSDPYVINYASRNLKDIEDLILNKRFTQFPPRSKKLQLSLNSDSHTHQSPIPEQFLFKDSYKNDKLLDFLRQGNFLRPITVFNVRVTRPIRSINQRMQNQRRNQRRRQVRPIRRQQNTNRMYQLNASPINNEDTLNRIVNLPRQTVDDPLINQFFNGFLI